MKRKPQKVEIGKFQHDAISRKRPDMDSFNGWKDSFLTLPEVEDFDAYLWGSWPEREDTWDIDVLMTKGNGVGLDLQELEELALLNLEKGLVDSGILIDLGFTDEPVRSFDELMNIYQDTGKSTRTNGYVYANDWFVDDVKRKDRSTWKGPFVEQLQNNIVKLGGAIPYAKQLRNGEPIEDFEEVYGHKPIKIKSRNKSY